MENGGIILGAIGTILGCMLARKKYEYSIKRSFFMSFFIVVLGVLECKIMSLLQSNLLNIISDGAVPVENGIRFIGVIVFEPLIILVLVLLSGEKYRKLMDFAAPGNFAALMFGKISCHIDGCCYGIPLENGVYSKIFEGNCFPVQLCESATSLLAIVTIYILLYKCRNIRKGSLFPIGCIIYCITRIFWEEFRYYDNEWQLDFFIGLNTWQFWCVVAITVSIVWLLILYLNPKYAECSFDIKESAPFSKLERKLNVVTEYLKHRNDKNIVHHNSNKKKYQKKK